MRHDLTCQSFAHVHFSRVVALCSPIVCHHGNRMSFAAGEQVVVSGGTNVGVASGGRVVINNWRKASLPQQGATGYGQYFTAFSSMSTLLICNRSCKTLFGEARRP